MTNEYANTLGVATYGYWSAGIGTGSGEVIVVTEIELEVVQDTQIAVEVVQTPLEIMSSCLPPLL